MPASPRAVPRVAAIDRLRAVALVMMLIHHFVKWLAGDARRILPGWDGFVLTDTAAPAFAIAAGASAVLFAESRLRKGQPVVGTIVRRYGMLIPIGAALKVVTGNGVLEWGVLHTLGATVTVSTIVALAVRRADAIAALTAVALAVGPVIELSTDDPILAGGFPLVTYLGFALTGATLARVLLTCEDCGRYALAAGAALTAVVLAMTLAGEPPNRYPGGPAFVIPGLAFTFLLYGVLDRWRPRPQALDVLLRRASAHTLGIFIAHYVVSVLISRAGWRDAVAPPTAVLLAIVATAALTYVAPRVPTLPWSPRTGWDQKRWASSAAYRATTASVSAVR